MNSDMIDRLEKMAGFKNGVDHMDMKSGVGTGSVRAFVAGVLSYEPGWMRLLWKIRFYLLRVLGQGQDGVPEHKRFTPDTLPVEAGQSASFFTVMESDGETYWVATGEENHLAASIAAVAEPLGDGSGRQAFHLVTLVEYRNKIGPIYFNIIRPFHHLVVACAMKQVLAR